MAHLHTATSAAVDAMRQPRITGHAAVRAAARDWQRFSSDLQGDRDVRDYRQLPLEADPPRHGLFRRALQPLFTAAAVAPHAARFQRLARGLIDGMTARGGGELIADLALPYVVGCLAIIFNRPRDYDEWLSWGPDVWTARAHAGRWLPEAGSRHGHQSVRTRQRSGEVLHAYLWGVLEQAQQQAARKPASDLDIWDHVSGIRIEDEPISREEMTGIGSVLLAGGRDTVAKLITGLVWHLINQPADRTFLAGHPEAFDAAVAELARFLSPLPGIERTTAPHQAPAPDDHEGDPYVVLDFASANHDPTVWAKPDRIDIHRPRQPHLGFGFGRHSCLGKSLAEHEARAFLTALLNPWPDWAVQGEPEIDWLPVGGGHTRLLNEFLAVQITAPEQ